MWDNQVKGCQLEAWAGKSPDESRPGQTFRYHRVLKRVIIVVIDKELVLRRLTEHGKSNRGQRKACPAASQL